MSAPSRELEIFTAALRLPPEVREVFLKEACGDDAVLSHRVQVLLRAHHQAGNFLEPSTKAPGAMISFPPAGERPGDLIGPYKLLQQIGEACALWPPARTGFVLLEPLAAISTTSPPLPKLAFSQCAEELPAGEISPDNWRERTVGKILAREAAALLATSSPDIRR